MNGRVLEERQSATAQSGNRFFSWPMRPSSSGGVRGQRIGQPDLIDDADVKADVDPQHAEIGEKHCVRALLGFPFRRRARRGGWGWNRGHHVPWVGIARRQQQGAVWRVVRSRQHGTHSRVVEIIGGRQWMRVAGRLRVEPSLVHDAGVRYARGVGPHAARIRHPQRPTRDRQPQHACGADEQIACATGHSGPSGNTNGITAIGASMQNNGVSKTRPCMKSPPWRIQYIACSKPLTMMKPTTACGLCTVRASHPRPGATE